MPPPCVLSGSGLAYEVEVVSMEKTGGSMIPHRFKTQLDSEARESKEVVFRLKSGIKSY